MNYSIASCRPRLGRFALFSIISAFCLSLILVPQLSARAAMPRISPAATPSPTPTSADPLDELVAQESSTDSSQSAADLEYLRRKSSEDTSEPSGNGKNPTAYVPPCQPKGGYKFCDGEAMCRYFDADAAGQAKLRGMDIGPKPDPKAERAYMICDLNGRVYQQAIWQSPGQRAGAGLSVQAGLEAVGRVVFPKVSVGTSAKESLAVIYQPVSWWAQGASVKPLRGSSAAGLVAIATPDRVDVMTGEAGVGVKRCGFVVSAATAGSCASEYGMSSVHGTASTKWGPSYTAKVETFYTITFELNGNPTTIPGFTTDWPGPSATAPIGVAEIQSLVGPQER